MTPDPVAFSMSAFSKSGMALLLTSADGSALTLSGPMLEWCLLRNHPVRLELFVGMESGAVFSITPDSPGDRGNAQTVRDLWAVVDKAVGL